MNNLKNLRIEKNLTQKEIADFLKCNQTAVGKYERGDLEPNIDTLSKLADFFGCSVDYLIGREDDFGIKVQPNDVLKNEKLSEDEDFILKTFRSLDSRDKDLFLGMVGNFNRPVSEIKGHKHKA